MSRLRWNLTAAVVTAAAVTFGIIAVPASGAANPTAEFQKTSDWGTGWEAKYTIRNGGSSALNSWTVEFDLPAGTAISSSWDAQQTKTGNHYKFTNLSWNGSVPVGGTAAFGFVGSGPGSPLNCTLNGASCGGGGTPPTTTTTPPTTTTTTSPPGPSGSKVVGYFAQWGVYGRNYHVKNIHTSGSAAKLTH
ncbi:MAG: cellulose binding domain-containing protein, partial [Actinomycetota bacterium]|nr:cellulose binding domain-containing protein [Actinomycetota bacterium]